MLLRIVKIVALFISVISFAGVCAYFTLNFIIKSEDTVIVPDLVGKDVVYVLTMLTDLGLNTKVGGSEYSAEIPLHNVIFQEPGPGAEIKKERDVRIIISKGAKFVMMPNLHKMSVHHANIILEENGLSQGNISATYDSKYNKDEVIAHFPLAGTMVFRGKSADLLISLGKMPNEYKMPDIKGLFLEEAILLIEKYGLFTGQIKSDYDSNKSVNTVLGQKPLSGHLAVEGSVVDLVVNKKKSKKSSELFDEDEKTKIFIYKAAIGFIKKHIKVKMNCFGLSIDLYDDFIKPGEEIWVMIPNSLDVSVLLYEDDELIITKVFGF